MVIKKLTFALVIVSVIVLVQGIFRIASGRHDLNKRGNKPSSILSAMSLLGPEYRLCCGNEDNQKYPAVDYNGLHGQYIVVHHSESPGNRYIVGERYDVGLGPVSTFLISSIGSTDCCLHPDVAYNRTEDQYLVVWQQYDTSQSRWEIYGRILPWDSPDFTITPFLISEESGANLKYPVVTWNSFRNQYMVVWQRENSSGQLVGIERRRVGADGTPVGTTAFVRQVNQPGSPDVVYNLASDKYLVVWAEVVSAEIDIYGGILNWEGTLQNQIFPITQADDDQQLPAVTTNEQDRYLVVWQDLRYGDGDWDIFGRLIDVGGNLKGSELHIAFSIQSDIHPAVTANGPGNQYLIAWQQSTTGGERIMSALYNSTGGELDYFEVAPGGFGDNLNPAVGSHLAGFLVTYDWKSWTPGTVADMYGRLWSPHAVFLPLVVRD